MALRIKRVDCNFAVLSLRDLGVGGDEGAVEFVSCEVILLVESRCLLLRKSGKAEDEVRLWSRRRKSTPEYSLPELLRTLAPAESTISIAAPNSSAIVKDS